jgi:hypothetical protein
MLQEVGPCVVDPDPEAIPRPEERLVCDLDRGPSGRGIAIEREESMAAEQIDHTLDRPTFDR